MPGRGGCLLPGGVSAPGGSAPGGVPTSGGAWSWGGVAWSQGGSAWCRGGGGAWSREGRLVETPRDGYCCGMHSCSSIIFGLVYEFL